MKLMSTQMYETIALDSAVATWKPMMVETDLQSFREHVLGSSNTADVEMALYGSQHATRRQSVTLGPSILGLLGWVTRTKSSDTSIVSVCSLK